MTEVKYDMSQSVWIEKILNWNFTSKLLMGIAANHMYYVLSWHIHPYEKVTKFCQSLLIHLEEVPA